MSSNFLFLFDKVFFFQYPCNVIKTLADRFVKLLGAHVNCQPHEIGLHHKQTEEREANQDADNPNS